MWTRAKEYGQHVRGLIAFLHAECERGVAPATALRNLSHAVAAYERTVRPLTPQELLQLRDARDVVRRRLWTRPPKRAVPMTHKHVTALWREDPTDMGLLVVSMFAGGLRFSDAIRIRGIDVTARPTHIELTLPVTKVTGYVCAPQTVAVCLPQAPRTALIRRAVNAGTRPLWTTTYNQYVAFLRRIDERLTAHSARRGLVHAALDANVDDAAVMRLTRHTSLEAFSAYAGRLPNSWLQQQLAASTAAVSPLQL